MNQNKILIVGGAGYIGSHMVKMLDRAGYKVVTLDNLSSGNRDAVLAGEFIEGCLSDAELLNELFTTHHIDAVFHFASYIQVGESVSNPAMYYLNNVSNTINLLNAMTRHRVKKIIFSSTAAVFGNPESKAIDETHTISPINPYGKTKAMVEQILEDYDKAYGLKSVSLRYFNACGADPEGFLGERHDPETHLIPLVLQTISGRRESLTIFGRDYDTLDGTCIRDYVHVQDLCQAHLLALDFLCQNNTSESFNLGNGEGSSVAQVIKAAESITGQKVAIIEGSRRPGDPARLVACSIKAKKILGWSPEFSSLNSIITHAWAWENRDKHREDQL